MSTTNKPAEQKALREKEHYKTVTVACAGQDGPSEPGVLGVPSHGCLYCYCRDFPEIKRQ